MCVKFEASASVVPRVVPVALHRLDGNGQQSLGEVDLRYEPLAGGGKAIRGNVSTCPVTVI